MAVDWLAPQEIGVDAFGRTHHLETVGTHTAFFGKTGSGKTRAARGFVAKALLDPRARLAVFDGKDDQRDWRPMMGLCDVGYVAGSSSAAVGAALRLLRELELLNNSRTGGDHGASEPVVVVVDEWYRIRQAAIRHGNGIAELDSLMADLAATCRSHFIHLVFCFQRGTTAYMPGDLGGNIGQRVQGWAATPREIQYSIHSNPDVVPARPGEFLVSADEGGSAELLVVPDLDHDDFEVVVAAARRVRTPGPPLSLVKCVPEPEDTDRPATWQEMVAVILEEAGEPMGAAAILEALPEDRRPTVHTNRFGRDFLVPDADSDWPTVTRSRTPRGTPGWALAEGVLPIGDGKNGPSARSPAPSPLLLTAAP